MGSAPDVPRTDTVQSLQLTGSHTPAAIADAEKAEQGGSRVAARR
jgi:uncharacterized protein YdeI (YjbR/CyaY-like superfamily)